MRASVHTKSSINNWRHLRKHGISCHHVLYGDSLVMQFAVIETVSVQPFISPFVSHEIL